MQIPTVQMMMFEHLLFSVVLNDVAEGDVQKDDEHMTGTQRDTSMNTSVVLFINVAAL